MGEKIDNWQEWTGSALVGVAITGYLYSQYASKPIGAPAESVAGGSGLAATEPLLANDAAAAGLDRAMRTASSAVPVLNGSRKKAALSEAGVAATPGSLPSLSFKRYLKPTCLDVPSVQEV